MHTVVYGSMNRSVSLYASRPLDTPGFFDSFSIVSSFLSQISDEIFSNTDETVDSTTITSAIGRHDTSHEVREKSEPCQSLPSKPDCTT